MLIAVISDTHRDSSKLGILLKKIKKADVLIHLGDNVKDAEELAKKFKGKIAYVRGNCDYGTTVPSEIIESFDGKKFFITHGHNYHVKSGLSVIKEKAQNEGINIVLYGHTHVSSIVQEDGIWFINPGSASEGRDGAESFAFIELKEGYVNPWLVIL